MSRDVTFEPIHVIIDGGVQEGRLALIGDHLIAVFVRVSPEESGGADGWFREAGFGPCGDLLTDEPPIFASLDEAAGWIGERVASKLGK